MRYWIKLSLGVIAGIVLMCVFFEAVLTLLDAPDYNRQVVDDEASGLIHWKPDASFAYNKSCFTNTVKINDQGFHGPQVVPVKGSGVFRIVVVGGSFVEAIQVPVSHMFTTLLEEQLNADPARKQTYEVIPVAYSGSGTFLDTLYYKRFGAPLQPDLVINVDSEYEFGRNFVSMSVSPTFDKDGGVILSFPKKNPRVVFIKNLLRRSRLVMNWYSHGKILQENMRTAFAQPFFPASPKAALASTATATSAPALDHKKEWDIEEKLLGAFVAEVEHDHAAFLLASWMSPQAGTTTSEEIPAHSKDIAARRHFSYADLGPSVHRQEDASGVPAALPCDGHWSSDGHRFAAAALFEYLKQHPALLTHKL